MFKRIGKSIKTQVWLLFAIIFAFNAIAVVVLLNGWSQTPLVLPMCRPK